MIPPRQVDDVDLLFVEIIFSQTESAPIADPLAGVTAPMAYSTLTISVTPTSNDDDYPPNKTYRPKGPPAFNGPPSWISGAQSPPSSWVSSASTWSTFSKATPFPEALGTTPVMTSPYVHDTSDAPSSTWAGYGNQHPGWHGGKERVNSGGLYAAAAIIPVVVLVMVGAIVFVCMRKRKRQRADQAVAQTKDEEMKMHDRSPPVSHAYMASPPGASPQYTTTDNHLPLSPDPAHLQPIILGPISSGNNGAYFTGIDTSDVISMTSTNNMTPGPPNPFSDNDSLAEPPPPYRPRSAAPPSLTNSSRQSSVRASIVLPATSRTHLIERSPFEDPFDDDAISDISSPTAEHRDDAMSAVSDVSYQNDPVCNRSSL
jgi:hypothetical protein